MTIDEKADVVNRAVEKALKNGWKPKTPDDATGGTLCDTEDVVSYWDYDIWPNEAAHVLFNQDFAKALWGYDEYKTTYTGTMGSGYSLQPAWMVHMYNMVTQPDPIQYLKETLK